MPEEYGHISDAFYLSQEEIEELRNKKHTLTEYGRKQLRKLRDQIPADDVIEELINQKLTDEKKQELKEMRKNELIKAKVSDEDFQKILNLMNNQEPYPDEMLEEVEKASQKFGQLAYVDEWEQEQEQRRQRVLERYNHFYNMECAGMPHGMPITPEHQQIIAFESMIDALRCEHLNDEFNAILISDIEDLIERLRNQANEFLKRVRKND